MGGIRQPRQRLFIATANVGEQGKDKTFSLLQRLQCFFSPNTLPTMVYIMFSMSQLDNHHREDTLSSIQERTGLLCGLGHQEQSIVPSSGSKLDRALISRNENRGHLHINVCYSQLTILFCVMGNIHMSSLLRKSSKEENQKIPLIPFGSCNGDNKTIPCSLGVTETI